MKRLLGHLALCSALGVLLATTAGSEAKGAVIYTISVSITDNTTSTTTTYTIANGGPNDTNPSANVIQVSGAFNTSATGVSLTGLNSVTTPTASTTSLGIGGDATVVAGKTDSYTITITTTHDSYMVPVGTAATLSQSESGTYTSTIAGGTQNFQSWWKAGSAPNNMTGPTPGLQTIMIPVTGASTESGSANTPASTNIPGYVVPYTLTNTITINVKGNGTASNSDIKFSGSTTVTATTVPEPASMVVFLTGMPLPLVVVGLLRRRRRALA